MRTIFPKPYADFVQRLRVPSGFILAAAFLYLAQPSWASVLLGLPFSLAGLALRTWAAGHLRKNEALTHSGPYAWTRNPLYLGTLLIALGCAAASGQWEVVALAAAVFLFVYLPVIELEQQHLRTLFPEFDAYAARVPLLIPRPPRDSPALKYDAAVWRRNKEWKAYYAFLAVEAFLVVRALLS